MTQFNEFDLEQAIWNDYINNDGNTLGENGLSIQPIMKRQLKIGNYGVADLVGFEREYNDSNRPMLYVTVYELKCGKIDLDSILQGFKYVKGISRLLKLPLQNMRLVMIGSDIADKSDFVYIFDHIESLLIYTVDLTIDGLIFDLSMDGYYLIDEGEMLKPLTISNYRKLLSMP